MAWSVNDRVVIAAGSARGLLGTLVEVNKPMKPYGKRHRIAGDDGESYWFQDYQKDVFFAVDSDQGRAVRAAYEDSLGPADLDADVAFAESVVAERRKADVLRAADRLLRHQDPRALVAHLDLASVDGTRMTFMGKPPGWIPSVLRGWLGREGVDLVPAAVDRLRHWFATDDLRRLCGVVAGALCASPDPRLVEVLRELSATASDPGIVAARLAAGDDDAYDELAKLRVVERDGRLELSVGGLTPAIATRLLERLGERAARIEQLDFVRGSGVAYAAIDLDAWLAWPELSRFPRLDLSESFTGAATLERVLASDHLSPELAHLDLTACDIGKKGCTALARSSRLASLRSLRIDCGDYDRTKWGPTHLTALFPAKGSLGTLEQLSIAGWKITRKHVTDLIAAKRCALTTAQVEYGKAWTFESS